MRNKPSKIGPIHLLAAILILAAVGSGQRIYAQAAAAPGKYTAENLRMEYIRAAVEKGKEFLYKYEPVYTFRPDYHYNYSLNFEVAHEVGNHALAVWALLDAGESYQNPPLYRRVNWVLSRDHAGTYDRSMRAQMLAELPFTRWAPWIRRDAIWLGSALTDKGAFPPFFNGGAAKGFGDNANSLYGALGLWGCERGNFKISAQVWKRIDEFWREAQQKTDGDAAAGWSLFHPGAEGGNLWGKRISGPMTAGAVASLSLTERYLYGPTPRMLEPGDNTSIHIKKGMRWLDENFSLADKSEESDWFYYMWTIQRVGHASGYRTFNGVDWFREVTASMLNQQRGDGSWRGDKGALISTGFALLYLSKAYDPLAISKVRFTIPDSHGKKASGNWNNRPHDIWNFVDYISKEYEYSTTWQIVELDQKPYSLIESPILYLATDTKVDLTEEQLANLKGYIEAGGLLITNPDGNSPEMAMFVKDLAAKLYPNFPLERVEKDHPFYSVHQHLNVNVPMQMVHNGVRPLIVHFTKDIGRGLQAMDLRSDSFQALSNIYLYVTGMNPRRARLSNNYVPVALDKPSIPLQVARIKHSGNYDPEPNALPQLKNMMSDYDIDMQISTVSAEQLGPHKLAFLTTLGDNARLTSSEARAIRDWIEAGGTLWIDACGGSSKAADNSLQLMQSIIDNAVATPLASDNPILSGKGLRNGHDNRRVKWRYYALRKMGPVYTPRLQVIELGDGRGGSRVAVVYSAEDLTSGIAGLDHWNIFGYSVESARKLAVNGALLAMYNRTPMDAPMAAAGNE